MDSQITNSLMRALVVSASLMAIQARENSNWSSDIPDSIEISPVDVGTDGTLSITISSDLSKAPQAAAFEFGSGLHGAKAEKYPIVPRNASDLFFFWDNPYMGDDAGFFVFKKIMHPGVKARPFLRPAINKYLPQLQQEVGTAFVIGLRQFFSR